jgi:ABC-2 type transport system permease protein
MFQFLIPLFLIFLSFQTITSERETSRLKLLIIQGKSLQSIAFAKILSVWTIGIVLILFATIIQAIFNANQFNSDSIFRLFIFISSYGAYYLIITSLSVFLSLVLKNNAASLASTIAIWVFWTIFLPKITGNAVEKLTPLPTRIEFQKAMDEDRSKGIDGHNPSGDREKELEKATLAKYKVDNLSQLPINFDGLVMQADEEYGNTVWDKHFGKLYDKFQIQKRNYQISGFVNPFSSLQNVSMGAAGTDMFHYLDFLKQAENYRRIFIKTLNDKHAYGGSKTGDWDWKADSEFFKSVADFNYTSPKITGMLNKYFIDVISLLVWVALLLLLINYSSKRVPVI